MARRGIQPRPVFKVETFSPHLPPSSSAASIGTRGSATLGVVVAVRQSPIVVVVAAVEASSPAPSRNTRVLICPPRLCPRPGVS